MHQTTPATIVFAFFAPSKASQATQSRYLSPASIALHEAAHAVVANALGLRIIELSASRTRRRLGYCLVSVRHDQRGDRNLIKVAAAAEAFFRCYPQYKHPDIGFNDDRGMAPRMFLRPTSDPQKSYELGWRLYAEARRELESRFKKRTTAVAVRSLARCLLAKRTMTGVQATAVIARARVRALQSAADRSATIDRRYDGITPSSV